MSNQIYLEGFSCPCVRLHPSQDLFALQSHGNYACKFSSLSPYKLVKRQVRQTLASFFVLLLSFGALTLLPGFFAPPVRIASALRATT